MRKDVKIGLAIAGVLFAVLIVYVFVPKGDTTDTALNGDNGEQLAPVDGSTGGDPAGPTDAGTDPVEPTIPPADPTVADAKPGDVFAPDANTGSTPDAGSAAADAGGTDWLKTFDTGNVVAIESHPPLLSQTPTARGDNDAGVTGRVTDADHGPGDAATVPPVVVPPVAETAGPVADAGNTGSTVIPPVAPPTDTPRTPAPNTAAPTSALGGSGARTHVMQRGETFSSIAKAVYGKSSYYLKIQQANPGLNPNAIKPGTEIKLPDITAVSSGNGDAGNSNATASRGGARESAAPVNATTEYRIQPNDSLYKISMKLYGNGGHVDELYENNAATIGSDPGRLKVGMVLKLHDAPRVSSQR
jgi:nucleoid-associated protein YgaU